MNLLDKAIGYVSPEAALRRSRARSALMVVRGYEAGRQDRRTQGWTATGKSATEEVSQSLVTVRNRARAAVRDDPYASRALNTLVSKSIGTGIRARPDKGAKAAWTEFEENCDFEGDLDLFGIQALHARSSFEAGECLIRRVRTNTGRVPLKLQVLEPDYIDGTKYGMLSNGNYAIAGIEVDRTGRRQAYWLYDQHPADNILLAKRWESRRVDAAEVIHFGEKLRPGQLRFMSRFATSMMRLRDLGDYEEAELVRKKIEACFAAFVVGGNPDNPLGAAATNTETQQRVETMAPGIIEYLGTGEDVKFGAPAPSGGYGEYTKTQLHAIAVGAGITYEQLTGDLSGVNYSSIRSGMADFRDLVETWRWIYFMPMTMRRIWTWFLDAAWTAGTIRSPRYNVIWTPPAWPYVNPVDDIKALKEEARGGMQSVSEQIRQRGYDPDEVFAEIADERKMLAEMGIVVDSNAATPAKAAAKPDAEPVAPPEKTEDDK